jgi:hypothetical protein
MIMSTNGGGDGMGPNVTFLAIEAQERTNLERAIRIVCRDGRSYATNGGRYVQFQVFTSVEDDASLLARVFGGNYYPHKNGWQWTTGHRVALQRIRDAVDGGTGLNFAKRMQALFDFLPKTEQIEPDGQKVETS